MITDGGSRRHIDPARTADVARWARSTGIAAITGNDPEYESRRHVYNRMHDAFPVAILEPRRAADVADILRYATSSGLAVAIRGGGHHVAGFGTCNAGLVIDLGRMRRVSLSRDGRTASVGGGARLGDLDRTLTRLGRVVPTGTVSATGIGGLALGGGIGWLIGRFGLTCDAIVGADVVTGDARLVRAEDPGSEDLLWALRGGGGGFGAVTRFRFRAFDLPRFTVGSAVAPISKAAAVLERVVSFLAGECPPSLTVAPVLRRGDDDRPVLSIDFCLVGDDEAPLRRLLEAAAPAMASVTHDADFAAWQRSTDAAFLPPMRGYWKAAYKRDLSSADIAQLVASMENAPTSSSAILLEHLHGAFHAVGADEAAFPLRWARFGVLFSARWPDRDGDAKAVAWARSGVAAIDPAGASGAYSNYSLADDTRVLQDFARQPSTAARIQRVKTLYDPDGRLLRNHIGHALVG